MKIILLNDVPNWDQILMDSIDCGVYLAPSGQHEVFSVQKIADCGYDDPVVLSTYYWTWLCKQFGNLLSFNQSEKRAELSMFGVTLLSFNVVNIENGISYTLQGGLLTYFHPKGSFEFLKKDKGFLVRLLHFTPKTPWSFYMHTQAPIHLWVMNKFCDQIKIGKK